MALTRMVSLGSIGAAVLFPVLVIFMQNTNYLVKGSKISYIIFGLCLAAIVIFNHRSNLVRIINGNENKLSFKKKDSTSEPKPEPEQEEKTVKDEIDEIKEEVELQEQPEIDITEDKKKKSKKSNTKSDK